MSKALKCDRCKRCFCVADEDGPLISFHDVYRTTAFSRSEGKYDTRIEVLDFCPDCTREFDQFMIDGIKED